MVQGTCAKCAARFSYVRASGRSGRPRILCDACSDRRRVRRLLICPECRADFEPAYGNQVCCSKACQRARRRRAESDRQRVGPKPCLDCGEAFDRRGYRQVRCVPCGAERKRQRDIAYRSSHGRRGFKANKGGVYRDVVGDRDRWICGICGELVDRTVRWPDLNCPSLDHVIPVSKGGEHSYENVQIAHWYCNVIRRDDDLSEWEAMRASSSETCRQATAA